MVLLLSKIQSVDFSYCKLSIECYVNVHLSFFFSNLLVECIDFGCTSYWIRDVDKDVNSLYGLIHMCLRE